MQRRRYPAVVIVLTLVLTMAVNITFTGWAQRRSDERFCEVVGAAVEAYREAPPVTETGKRVQAAQERLYTQLSCH
jgi:hypothetical protein